MANSLPWSVKGVDPRTRDAAKAAARRAGMTLGEWLDHKIRVESAEQQPAGASAAVPEQLDIAALSERLAQLSQGKTDTAPRAEPRAPSRSEIDSLIRQAATAEKLTRETSTRTASRTVPRLTERAAESAASFGSFSPTVHRRARISPRMASAAVSARLDLLKVRTISPSHPMTW